VEGLRYFSQTELLKFPKVQDLLVLYREFTNRVANDLSCFGARESLKRRLAGRSESVGIAERPINGPALFPAP
jgi:hypothetical protein